MQRNDDAAHSPVAMATALRFATTQFGNTRTLAGSPEIQRFADETAVLNRIRITFADPALEAYREKCAADQQRTKGKQHAFHFSNKLTEKNPPARLRNRLRDLFSSDMVLDTERDVGALRKNVYDRLEQHQKRAITECSASLPHVPGQGKGKER